MVNGEAKLMALQIKSDSIKDVECGCVLDMSCFSFCNCRLSLLQYKQDLIDGATGRVTKKWGTIVLRVSHTRLLVE